MDITSLSTEMSQESLQQNAAVRIQKMAMDGAKDQGASLIKMMDTASVITDPELGNRVNMLA